MTLLRRRCFLFPVAWVCLAPSLGPLHILRAAEVVAVGWLAQPTLLAGLLDGVAAIGLGAVMLAVLIAVIGDKELAATAALASCRTETHRSPKPSPSQRNQKKNQPPGRRPQRKKEEELLNKEPEENPDGRKRNFKPADLIHFHSAAVKYCSC